MTEACPYCEKDVEARGRKNHVRLSSGGGHGEKGEVPDSYENDIQEGEKTVQEDEPTESPPESEAASGGADAAQTEPVEQEGEAAEVTADTLGDTTAETPDESEDDSEESLPFDPDAEGAIELDGTEEIYVRHKGEIVEANPEEGDYLLITEDGPVLYDPEQNARFEVVTE